MKLTVPLMQKQKLLNFFRRHENQTTMPTTEQARAYRASLPDEPLIFDPRTMGREAQPSGKIEFTTRHGTFYA